MSVFLEHYSYLAFNKTRQENKQKLKDNIKDYDFF